MPHSLPKSVVFITGTFIGHNCWDEWKIYFESKGFSCIAPAWPHKKTSSEELRNSPPDNAIASNRLATVTDYFAGIINEMPEKPILIGHSFGGLIVQLLLQRGLGIAGIAVHSLPPKNVRLFNFSLLKTLWEAMGFFTSAQVTYMVSFRKWKLAFANGIDCDEQKELYYKYAIPESKMIVRDIFKPLAKINFKTPHAPLLFVSGSRDRITQTVLNHDNYKKYKNSDSITSYKNFKDHGHLVFDYPEWVEEAEFILHWLQGIK